MPKKNISEKPKAAARVPYSKRMYDQDPEYWGMPLYERAYLRILYALASFIVVAAVFDSFFHSPMWMQILLGASVGAATLVFRMAYPKGFASIWEWVMEGMAEAAEDMESKGKTPKISSQEIKRQLKEQKELDDKRRSKK